MTSASASGIALARVALVSPFAVSAALKLTYFADAMSEVRALIPIAPAAATAAAVIGVQALGSVLCLKGGRAGQIGALLLGAFTLGATFLVHAFWREVDAARITELNTFLEHFGLVGGFALVALWPARDEVRD